MDASLATVPGEVLFDSAACPVIEQETEGFSLLGTRRVVVTDHPAVSVHDTGGLGAPYLATAQPAREPAVSVGLVEHSTRLRVRAELPGGRRIEVLSTGTVPGQVLAGVSRLAGRLLPGSAVARFVTGCAVSLTLEYEDRADPVDDLVAYVVVAAGRVQLRAGYEAMVDWPANRVTAAPAGSRAVRLTGGAVRDGQLVAGATLHLATAQERAALLAALGKSTGWPAAAGTSAPVTVRGLDGGEPRQLDCVLGESLLELQARTGSAVLASFDLADPQLRIAGTATRFVLFHPAYGALALEAEAETFGSRVHAHPGLQAAARTTLAGGPYPAQDATGRPVACLATAGALRVKGAGLDVRLAYSDIETVVADLAAGPGRARLAVTTGTAEVTLAGQLELVQAVHTALVAGRNAVAGAGAVPDLLRAAVGLAEDYLLTTVFGPFYELHAALPGVGQLAEPARLPEAAEQRAGATALLADGLAALSQHLDRVALMLPAYLRHRDAQLLAGAEPDWLKTQEAQLRQALAPPVQRAAVETGQLLAQAERLRELDPLAAEVAPDYSGAALTLGVGALLNPLLLVAGAAQAYRQRAASQQRSAALDARATAGGERLLARWNTLVSVTLPLLGYQLTENMFGLWWQAARQLTAALASCPEPDRPAAVHRVATRLARLDVQRRYPASGLTRLRRGEIATYLRTALDAVVHPFPEL